MIWKNKVSKLHTIQSWKGFGVELNISILTLLILVGVIFSGVGIYFINKDFQIQLSALIEENKKNTNEIAQLQKHLLSKEKYSFNVFVKLNGRFIEDMPPDEIKCLVVLYDEKEEKKLCLVEPGPNEGSYKIKLDGVSANTHIKKIIFSDSKGRRWLTPKHVTVSLFEPEFVLVSEPF